MHRRCSPFSQPTCLSAPPCIQAVRNAAGFPHGAMAASSCRRKALVGCSHQLESMHCWAGEAAVVCHFRAEERRGEWWHLLCNLEPTLYLAELVMDSNTSWGHQGEFGPSVMTRVMSSPGKREREGLAMNSLTPRGSPPFPIGWRAGTTGEFQMDFVVELWALGEPMVVFSAVCGKSQGWETHVTGSITRHALPAYWWLSYVFKQNPRISVIEYGTFGGVVLSISFWIIEAENLIWNTMW